MRLSTKGQKALKTMHLVFVTIWFGSAVVMNLLRHLVEVKDAAGLYHVAYVLEAIDMKILVPGAIGCLLTGIAYGLFTNWGFFKHRWLAVKWALTVFMIAFGTFYMGPLVKENVIIGRAILDGTGDASRYWTNVEDSMYGGLLQLMLLVAVFVISVYKPWKKKKTDKKKG